ncbi:MAG: crossover junction endodeoxyribonuclease RuvC [Candidatus Portnoybacteria bacterium]|nr:crossover junction endodeoxyribonuclease RuvC [Candidatus Portnoybacteria bacterium]
MIILGIDPGNALMGYGLIEDLGGKIKFIEYGCFATEKNLKPALRLEKIFKELSALIKKYKPETIAMESLFFFKNQKTIIKVSQAQGIVMLAAALEKLPIVEFTPPQVKQAVTGYGKAEKQQVQKMVKAILNLKEIPKPDDAADALAIAICAGHCRMTLPK